jgi:hypothetical protein
LIEIKKRGGTGSEGIDLKKHGVVYSAMQGREAVDLLKFKVHRCCYATSSARDGVESQGQLKPKSPKLNHALTWSHQ